MGKGTAVAITGLEYFRLRSNSEGQPVYGVLVTTATRLYQFQAALNSSSNRSEERPLLLPLFYSYLNAKGNIQQSATLALVPRLFSGAEKFIEIPSDFAVSRLRVFINSESQRPVHVAWMTGNGVLLAQVRLIAI